MSEEIYRKESLEKVKSPENLDDYIKVSNPGVWLLLISIIVLLAGMCIWGVFGTIEVTQEAQVEVSEGGIYCSIESKGVKSLQDGMIVRFDGFETNITRIFRQGSAYICELKSNQDVPDGYYIGNVVLESTHPMSFIVDGN